MDKLKIAEEISEAWPNLHLEGFDIDECTLLIETYIPDTRAEFEAELDKLYTSMKKGPVGPTTSALAELRLVLELNQKFTIISVIRTATERITKMLKLVALVKALDTELDGVQLPTSAAGIMNAIHQTLNQIYKE